MFLVDASSEVGKENFLKEKKLIKSLAQSLNLAPGKSRVAVLLYSTYSRPVILFDDFKTLKSFESGVDGLYFTGRTRRMDRALEGAVTLLGSARTSVPNIVVLLTAGTQDRGADSLADSVKPLQDRGAQTYVVAIGQRPNALELQPVVKSTDDIFPVKSFDDLTSWTRRISTDVVDRIGQLKLKERCAVFAIFQRRPERIKRTMYQMNERLMC